MNRVCTLCGAEGHTAPNCPWNGQSKRSSFIVAVVIYTIMIGWLASAFFRGAGCNDDQDIVDTMESDAARFRWLTKDHSNPFTRQRCRDILARMGAMSYSATCIDIDLAMVESEDENDNS